MKCDKCNTEKIFNGFFYRCPKCNSNKKKWHFKKENTPESKMLCGRNAQMNGGTASFTTSIREVFMSRPCKQCLNKLLIQHKKE